MRAVLVGSLFAVCGVVLSTVVPVVAEADPLPADHQAVAADERSASDAARRQGTKVEVADRTTETARVFANPDGSFTAEQEAVPVRVRAGSGWIPVDTALRPAPDGSVVPGATAVALRFSGGGTGPFATMTKGARSLSWSWPYGELPAPVIAGETATYRQVFRGVDLKVTASPSGFRHVVVVHDRTAAADPRLARLRFGFNATGVTVRTGADGVVQATDETGKVVFAAPPPEMWDTPARRPVAVTRELAAADVEDWHVMPQRRARLVVEIDMTGLTLVPDRELLADETTQYPVEIDPDWTGYISDNAWTSVWSNYADSSFWQRSDTSTDTDKGMAKVGQTCNNYNGTAGSCTTATKFTVRSFFRMNTADVEGKIILGATFRIQQRHSVTCNPGSDAGIWLTSDIGPGTTWNSQPYWNEGYKASAPANHRVDAAYSCAGPGNVEFNATSMVAAAAGAPGSTMTVGMRALDEGNLLHWKRYLHSSPQLSITYNTIPGIPTNLDISGKPCATGNSRAVLGASISPRARATVYDPDAGQTITGVVKWSEVYPNNVVGTEVGSREQPGLGNGQAVDVTMSVGQLQFGDQVVDAADWDKDGRKDVIVKTRGGDLSAQPVTRNAQNVVSVAGGYRIGIGWGGYTIAGVADWDRDGHMDILGRENSTGELWLYPGVSIMGFSQEPRVRIGTGWNGFTYAGVADWDLDGKQDVIARNDATMDLLLYSGAGNRLADAAAWAYSTTANLGTGWAPSVFTLVGVVDWDRDGKPDVITRDSDSVLWMYPGSGARSPYAGTPFRFQLGSGWGPMDNTTVRAVNDLDGDGAADVLARWGGWNPSSFWFYRGSGARAVMSSQYKAADVGDVADGRRYAWQAAGRDSLGWWGADWSSPCEFEVDGVPPALPPTVSSVDYPADGEFHGGVGRPGIFTLGAAGVTDVVKYRYGLITPPQTEVTVAAGASVPVSVTPTRFGLNMLYVESLDRAGNVSTRHVHTFNVNSPTAPIAQWRMSENGGTTVADASGNDHPMSLQSGASVGGGVATFNGSTSHGQASVPLNTSKSFTVSAWVRLTGTSDWGGVISKDGTTVSSFYLQYLKGDNRWAFSMATADSASNNGPMVKSIDAPVLGAWTHLTAVHDVGAHTISLYVNGVLQGTVAHTSPWNATGALQIGRYKWWSGTYGSYFAGDIDEVRVWDRVVVAEEQPALLAGDTDIPALHWELDDGAGDTASDSSGNDRSGTVAPDATWTTGNRGVGDGAVRGSVSTNGSVLRTDQSYTVAAWVRIDNKQSAAAVVSQAGTQTHGFVLEYAPGTDRWGFTVAASDTTGAARVSAWSTNAPAVGQWTHLAGVFNAATGKLTLYVNGAAQGSVDHRPTFTTTGSFSVGTAKRDGTVFGRFAGDVDDAQVFSGALPQNLIQLLATS